MKRLLVGMGLATWGFVSLTCLAVGIYGGATQAMHESRSLAALEQVSSDGVSVTIEPVVVEPVVVNQVPAVTDNTPCGSGCVRASFIVVK